MAKPKPPEPVEKISLSAPESLKRKLEKSAAAPGKSVNAYCVAVLADAARRQIAVETKTTIIEPSAKSEDTP